MLVLRKDPLPAPGPDPIALNLTGLRTLPDVEALRFETAEEVASRHATA